MSRTRRVWRWLNSTALFGPLLCCLIAVAATAGTAQEVAQAPGAVLRGLDKIAGSSEDYVVDVGAAFTIGTLVVTLAECRFPRADPASEAYAWLTIRDESRAQVLFDGWMIASSPGLNALDHPRYDVWVLNCRTS